MANLSSKHKLIIASVMLTAAVCGLPNCKSGGDGDTDSGRLNELPGVAVAFNTEDAGEYFSYPVPNDLKIVDGVIDFSGFPEPENAQLLDLLLQYAADERTGWSLNTPIYIPFEGGMSDSCIPLEYGDALADDASLMLVDIDPNSAEQGRKFALSGSYYRKAGNYVTANLMAVAPWPGLVLRPSTTYALLVTRNCVDLQNKPAGRSRIWADLLSGETPDIAEGERAAGVYAPLVEFLRTSEDVDARNIVAAAVFTTDDPVGRFKEIYDYVVNEVEVDGLQNLTRTRDYEDYCVIGGTFNAPQYQQGTAPYPERGDFDYDEQGRPIEVRREVVPFNIAVPKGEMPAGGWPLTVYVHGSGGLSTQLLDRGYTDAEGKQEPGTGPALWLAKRGIASAGSAMPVNPERVPSAGEWGYLNIENPIALRDNMRQGTVEIGIFLSLLLETRFAPDLCTGTIVAESVSDGKIFFDPEYVFSMGQSMGALYLNTFSTLDSRLKAVIPSGAGAYWSYFLLNTTLMPAGMILGPALDFADDEEVTYLHPAFMLLQMTLEACDPVVYVHHIAAEPFAGTAAKNIYMPCGYIDGYWAPPVQTMMAMRYGLDLAGDVVNDDILPALENFGKQQLSLPLENNLTASDGSQVTAAVLQFEEDGIKDGHYVSFQLTAPRYQYSCFLRTLIDSGTAKILQPRGLDDPCE